MAKNGKAKKQADKVVTAAGVLPSGPDAITPSSKQMIEAETLKGDIRDQFLNYIKYKHTAFWEKLTEREQQQLIDETARIGRTCVDRALIIIKSDAHDYVAVTMGKIGLADEIDFKATAPYSDKSAQILMKCRLKSVMLVAVDSAKYMKERKPAEPDKVGSLGLPKGSAPKTGPGAPSDPEALAKLGRGKGAGDVEPKTATEQKAAAGQTMPGDVGPMLPENRSESFHDPQTGEVLPAPPA